MTEERREITGPVAATRRAELLAALSIAEDLGVGLPQQYVLRSCYIAMHLARRLGLPPAQARDVFYTSLLEHAGCTGFSTQVAAFIRGDEQAARRDLVLLGDYTNNREILAWVRAYV